jgi:UDP-N-acetylmuramate dehydrogenase
MVAAGAAGRGRGGWVRGAAGRELDGGVGGGVGEHGEGVGSGAPPGRSGCAGIDDALRRALKPLGGRVRFQEPLARYTSLRVGGPADVFVRAESVDDIVLTLAAAEGAGVPVFVLGGGTNLLVSDRGVRGLVLVLGRTFDHVEWVAAGDEDVQAVVGAAVRVGRLVRQAVAAGLAGLEAAEGIPGTVGGGLLMNAGAYGVEMGDLVHEVTGVAVNGRKVGVGREQLAFRYRHAALPPGFVVTGVTLRLRRASRRDVRERMLAVRAQREASQPRGYPTAGSMFKNPSGDYAARLIEAAGLKGRRLGQVQISGTHANFFVNLGGGRAAEVRALMDLAQRVVWERFQAWLEPEVRLVGQW